MPQKSMMGGEMADMDSLYGGGSPAGETEPGDRETVDQETQEDVNTAVVPVKVLMGPTTEPLKEGDEVVLKIVKLYGDEAEVAYSTTKPGEIGEREGYGKSADQEIDEMDQGGAGGAGMGY